MDLFKTEMLRAHPPQRRSYGPRRARPGCRSVPVAAVAQPLAAAVRLALAPPAPPVAATVRDPTAEAA